MEETKPKSRRGFACLAPERRREIARAGGRRAHEMGTAHEFTPDKAREAGKLGGQKISADRKHMAEIGKIGGRSRGLQRKIRATQ